MARCACVHGVWFRRPGVSCCICCLDDGSVSGCCGTCVGVCEDLVCRRGYINRGYALNHAKLKRLAMRVPLVSVSWSGSYKRTDRQRACSKTCSGCQPHWYLGRNMRRSSTSVAYLPTSYVLPNYNPTIFTLASQSSAASSGVACGLGNSSGNPPCTDLLSLYTPVCE